MRILNISNNSSLDSESLKTALSTMCTMKHIIDTLAATKVAVTVREDLEISVVQVLTTKLYYHSCELVCNMCNSFITHSIMYVYGVYSACTVTAANSFFRWCKK